MSKLSVNAMKCAFALSVIVGCNAYAGPTELSSQGGGSAGCAEYDPNDARLPQGKGCEEPKTTIKYDPDCARLDGCADNAAQQAPTDLKGNDTSTGIGLLLPAVQKGK